MQTMLSRWTLNRQLIDFGILKPGEATSDDPTFEHLFRNMWADNADVVSNSYSGTGALKTDFTRTGERTKAGMLQDLNNSITRYARNNFMDGPKQDAFDLFLGAYLPSTSNIGSALQFTDRRPILIQSIPYILATSVFMVLISILTRRLPDSAVWPLRVFLIFWFVVGGFCLQFIYAHGMLYVSCPLNTIGIVSLLFDQVNWPKLNTPPWGSEGYQEALISAHKDNIVGPWIDGGKRQRVISNARLGYMEEGKKRIE